MTTTDPNTAAYIERATEAVQSWRLSAPRTCPECGTWAGHLGEADTTHVVIVGPGQVLHVIVGCQGYWTINPAALGLTA